MSDCIKTRLKQEILACADVLYDLEKHPIIRLYLFQRSATEWVQLFTIHQIANDSFTKDLFLKEFQQLYGGIPVKEPLAYTDFVNWESEMLKSPWGETLWQYWEKQLAGELPILDLPTDLPRPSLVTYRRDSHEFKLNIDQEAISYVREKLEKLDSSAQGKEILETATKYIDEQGTSFSRVRDFLEVMLIPSLDFDFYTYQYDDQIAVDDNAMDTSDEESTSSLEQKITEKPVTTEAQQWVTNIQKKSLEFYIKLTQFRDQGYYVEENGGENRDFFAVVEDFLALPDKPRQTSASTSAGTST
ncbi:MAG: hypothetical protein F6J90_19745 [Moorea sp. SIOASIH]|uniref:condensation domain-containing protein n=1 Tax=Moorena sp. SIOASIH TaxID=2607817 RepID=UPI0013BAAD9C|nr:condensation domain-containing protein [Moorena sp. SIOASIH]NEO38447.1 hypothetical protein [Moorena sp. SIOASIH]